MLLHGVKSLLCVLEVRLVEATNAIAQALVREKDWIEGISQFVSLGANLLHQLVVVGLLVFGLTLVGRERVVFRHLIKENSLQSGVLFPVEALPDFRRRERREIILFLAGAFQGHGEDESSVHLFVSKRGFELGRDFHLSLLGRSRLGNGALVLLLGRWSIVSM